MKTIPVIHDGDHGSDDFIATLIFAAHPERFDLLGVTTGFGNTNARHAVRNAGLALALAGRRDVPLCRGGDHPFTGEPKPGDHAFDEGGLGGIILPLGPSAPGALDSVAWMAHTLENAERPVTLCLTGTATNAALLLRDHPHVKTKIAHIVVMGGCIGPLGAGGRHGNITMFAEFNFFMDPEAAAFIFDAGIPVTLLPMDATHQCVFTPERQQAVLASLPAYPGRELVAMMRAAEKYDMPNFDLPGAVFHDQNVPAYLLAPHLYKTVRAGLFINTDASSERHGQMRVDPHDGRAINIVEALDAEAVFEIILSSLRRLFPK
jgi:purine nucleosidase